MKRLIIALCALIFVVAPAFAVNPDEMLDDPALEARARSISENLRCLVCQNQSIDDSDADLAADLRVLVRERLVAGDSDEEVTQYLVDRYGEFVLLNPVVAWHTLALWIAAPLIFLIGFAVLVANGRKLKLADGSGMTHQEEAALKSLALNDDEQDDLPKT